MDIVEAIDHRGRGGSAMRRFRYGQRWMIASLAVPMLAGVLVVSSATGVIRAQPTETPTLEEIAARYGLEIWGAGNLQTLESLFADDVVDHNAFPGQAPGREGIKETLVAYRAAFPNLTLTNDDIVVGSDRVVLRWTARGTHEGELMGIPASGAEVTMTGIDILRVENGKVVERWGEFNGLELMQQIGVVAS
jgi:steroid delta-isomerase-like uncharacterized protein